MKNTLNMKHQVIHQVQENISGKWKTVKQSSYENCKKFFDGYCGFTKGIRIVRSEIAVLKER